MDMAGAGLESLTELLARQDNIAHRAQLVAAGIIDTTISRRIRRGVWQRIAPAVYALHATVLSTEQRRIAAALYAGVYAQLTGPSALLWYGFRNVPVTEKVHILVPHGTRRRSTGVIHVQRTHELDLAAREGGLYQVVSPARAVVDAARISGDLSTVRAIFTEAVHSQVTDVSRIGAELRRAKRSRTAVANRVLAEMIEGIRSAPEGNLRDLVLRSPLPLNVLWNPILVADDGTRLPTPDGYLVDTAIALEVDSIQHHTSKADFQETVQRGNDLSWRGVTVLHFTPAEIRAEGARVLRVIEATWHHRHAHPVPVRITAHPRAAQAPHDMQ